MKKYAIVFSLVIGAALLTSGTINLAQLYNYAGQSHPVYVNKDNTGTNTITNPVATLGRVLFYDKKLSANNTVACGSCHLQAFAFSDTALQSAGAFGPTERHAMRLVNARFGVEPKFFWDERAATLEDQTTMPIQNHEEMGYSGTAGQPNLNQLLAKLDTVGYYHTLFTFAFGDTQITEQRLKLALSQFVRSIQSFDSKYDVGRAAVGADQPPFPNFTQAENNGKQLFLAPPQFDANGVRQGGGAGCAGCHQPPEFDIDPNTRNNGFMQKIGGGTELGITRSPSLRNLENPAGQLNGPLMHNGAIVTLNGAVQHYNNMPDFSNNPALFNNLDPRLRPNGHSQQLNLSNQEVVNIVSFLRTLTGSDVYTNPMWSDPFDSLGNLTIVNSPNGIAQASAATSTLQLFPNPANDFIQVRGIHKGDVVYIVNAQGAVVLRSIVDASTVLKLDIGQLANGPYWLVSSSGKRSERLAFVKR